MEFDVFMVVSDKLCPIVLPQSSQILEDNAHKYKNKTRYYKLMIASAIVDGTFRYFDIHVDEKECGRNPWNLKNMIKLIYLSSIEKIQSSIQISDRADSDNMYQEFCGDIRPSARSIRDYRIIYFYIERLILKFTLIVAKKLNLTSFKHVSDDGTIMYACNSPHNTIKRKDVRLLIKHFMVEELSKKEIKLLRKPAKKFLYNKKIDADDKIEMLFDWYDKLELTGQKSIPLHDTDARWMYPKEKGSKYKKLAYNVQICTDTETKLICGINPVQFPTDHYQIPALMDQTIDNLQMTPSILSADNIYGTLSNLFYLKQHGISARIPTREQSKKELDKLSSNMYHKDHFLFDKERNLFVCPQEQELTQTRVQQGKLQKGGFRKMIVIYSNPEACRNCPVKSECTKAKYRTVSRQVHELSYEIELIMDTSQGKKDYSKRISTAESHNGTFQRIFHYNDLYFVKLKNIQQLMFRLAASYNCIRIFNIVQDMGLDVLDVIRFIYLI